MIANKWWRGWFYSVAIFTMLLFGYLALESYRQEMWVGFGTTVGWCFIGAWMFFGLSFTPSKRVEIVTRLNIAEPSDAAKRAIFYPTGQYVYLIQDTSITGYFKIGKTNCPSRRMNEFGVKLPMDLMVIHIIPCKNMSQLEAQLHQQYIAKRVNGEWFTLAPQDVSDIKEL